MKHFRILKLFYRGTYIYELQYRILWFLWGYEQVFATEQNARDYVTAMSSPNKHKEVIAYLTIK